MLQYIYITAFIFYDLVRLLLTSRYMSYINNHAKSVQVGVHI